MPARKPVGLHTGASTKAARQARTDQESSMASVLELPMDAPSLFNGKPTAAAVYRRVMRFYASTDAKIITRLDQDLLVSFCELIQEAAELKRMRSQFFSVMGKLELPDAVMLDSLLKLDSRIDRKRALIHQHMQSLYLTPRSRSGAAPNAKKNEEPPDDMEKLLSDVNSFINNEAQP